MSKLVRMRGALPLPNVGRDGAVMLFRSSDMMELEAQFGEAWFQEATVRHDRFDLKWLEACMRVGAKTGEGKRFDPPLDVDDYDGPVAELSELILDGLYVATFGRLFGEHVQFVTNKMAALTEPEKAAIADEANPARPPESPETFSTL